MPTNRLQRSLRATFLGLATNVTLTVVKFLAGFFGHSQALIADAVESLADIFSSIIVWRGLVVAETPPDEDHPYGHGKAEPLAAAIVSAMLLLAAGLIAYHSLRGIIEPRVAPSPWTLIVLVVVIAIKETLFRFVLRESETVSSSAVETDAWHHRSDAITSAAAFIGITISLVGGPDYRQPTTGRRLLAACVIGFERLAAAAAGVQRIDGPRARPQTRSSKSAPWPGPFPAWRAWKNPSSARWATSFSWTCTSRLTRR